jgi:hypothetical protein
MTRPKGSLWTAEFGQPQDVRVRGSKQIWREGGLVVRVRLTDDDDLEFAGQDFGGHPFADQYEYWITVPARDVPTIVAALNGQPGDDVLELVARHAASIIHQGERAWVESLGIEPRFYSW